MDYKFAEDGRCRHVVYTRDTYRYTGRGKSGFSMHYNKHQCTRKDVKDGYCRQHWQLVNTYKPFPEVRHDVTPSEQSE